MIIHNSNIMPHSNSNISYEEINKKFYVDLKTKIEIEKLKNGVSPKHIKNPQQIEEHYNTYILPKLKCNDAGCKIYGVQKSTYPTRSNISFGKFYVSLKVWFQNQRAKQNIPTQWIPTKSEIAIDYLLNTEPKLKALNKI